jgi:large subunit ribosomal protein L23
MNQERLLTILKAPHVSEKAVSGTRQYAFKVMNNATKMEIKKAIEQVFDVTVEAVRVLNVKGKQKRFAQRLGCRKGWKKAYVKLAEGSEIEMASGQA